MATVILNPGDTLTIMFSEANDEINCDGQFQVHFDTEEHPQSIVVKETGGFDGSKVGLGMSVLYHEEYFQPDSEDEQVLGSHLEQK